MSNPRVIDSEDVIKEVKKHPCLYDTTSEEHKNRLAKNEAWTSVFRSLAGNNWNTLSESGQTLLGREVQKRWKSLKDAYARTMKGQEVRSGCVLRKPYVYHKHLSFLLPFLQNRSSQTPPLTEPVPSTSQENAPASIPGDPEEPPRSDAGATLRLRSPRPEELFQDWSGEDAPPPRKRQRLSTELPNSFATDDPELMFFCSVLPYFKNLSPVDKINFQIEVMQTLKKFMEGQDVPSMPVYQPVYLGIFEATGQSQAAIIEQAIQSGIIGQAIQSGINRQASQSGMTGQVSQSGMTGQVSQSGMTGQASQTGINGQACQSGINRRQCQSGINRRQCQAGINRRQCQSRINERERQSGINEMQRQPGINEMQRQSGTNEMEHQPVINGMELQSGANEMEHESGINEMEHQSGINEMERQNVRACTGINARIRIKVEEPSSP